MNIACVGTRTLTNIQAQNLGQVGRFLARKNHRIVSGNAEGADHAFALGANTVDTGKVLLFLPWDGFRSEHIADGNLLGVVSDDDVATAAEVWKVHREHFYGYGSWDQMADSTKRLMARNVSIIRASDKVIAVPSFDGRGNFKGGTGFAISIGEYMSKPIQVIDLRKPADPTWDLCGTCGLGRTFFACGGAYHSLAAYA